MKEKHTLLLGGHMPISGGLGTVFSKGESLGCTAIQFFTKSNRQWAAKKITDEDANLFKEASKKSQIKNFIVHASYLINIGSQLKELNEKSVKSLIEELQRCETLGVSKLVLHPGNRQNSPEEECLDLIASNINNVFEAVPGHSMILLENAAGSGSSVCYNFEQIAYVINKIKNKKRIGICFDTCHAFAAGYNFNTLEGYKKMWNDFDNILGINHLKAMHINDSKKECGSRVDRHEHIGKGKISKEAFEMLFNDERFFDIPKVLETPYEEIEEYIPDLQTIVRLIETKNKSLLENSNLERYLK